MKKFMRMMAVLLTMVFIVLSLAACGETEVPEPAQEATATPEPTPTATPAPTPEPVTTIKENGFTFDVMDATMTTTANLNVRSLPDIEGGKIGMFPKGAQVSVSGQCVETGWYRVSFQGEIGYVSNEYLQ